MKNYKDFKADLLSNEALRLELENAGDYCFQIFLTPDMK